MSELIVLREGSAVHLRLNRPEAINALTHGMVRQMNDALDWLENDPHVAAFVISGEGDRGLCAGGDIRSLYEAPRHDDGPSMAFWRDEYRLDARLAGLSKPVVSIMSGLVMGGGIGISAHCSHRVVTETSKIAMPECGIGFVPDVGATWLLSRAPGELGTWMGLTGRILAAADAIRVGFADAYIPSGRIAAFTTALAELPTDADRIAVDALVAEFAENPGPAALDAERDLIDRTFCHDRVENILAALGAEAGEFAERTLKDLRAKSPTSLKLALLLSRLGRHVPTLEAALELEFAACRTLVKGPDFYEGIRAQIIDKDRNPQWSPATLAEVSDDWVWNVLQLTSDRVFPASA